MNEVRILHKIIDQDPRYPLEAYLFVLEALMYTRQTLKKEKHVSGRELLEGIRVLVINRYGAMAKAVLDYWGVKKTQDFGNIVFNMVRENVLSKTDEDSPNDFNDVYDFEETFVKQYAFRLKDPRDTET